MDVYVAPVTESTHAAPAPVVEPVQLPQVQIMKKIENSQLQITEDISCAAPAPVVEAPMTKRRRGRKFPQEQPSPADDDDALLNSAIESVNRERDEAASRVRVWCALNATLCLYASLCLPRVTRLTVVTAAPCGLLFCWRCVETWTW